MPKVKTKRTLYKRIKITKKGKFLRRRAGKSHLLIHKSKRRKRKLRRPKLVTKTERKIFRKMINL